MKKKLVSALLISTMALTAFVGCGEKKEEKPARCRGRGQSGGTGGDGGA